MKIKIVTGVRVLPKNIAGIVLFPFVLFSDKKPSKQIMIHELTHVSQIRRHGVITFYLSYVIYWVANLIRYKNFFEAYYEIPYEIEARQAEDVVDE